MAKKATGKSDGGKRGGTKKSTAVARVTSSGNGGGNSRGGPELDGMGDAFIKLLQSPLVADLVAVAATAALASLAEHGFTTRGAADDGRKAGKRAGKAVKEAGKAAAAAVGRRLSNELDEIRKASKAAAGV